KTAKGRKTSSTLWLKRQLNDPYVDQAQKLGYRSRAAFKLIEIDEKAHLLKSGMRVVDLGAAPGGWCQVAEQKGCKPIVAIDLLAVDDLPGVDFIQMDFMDDSAPQKLKDMLGGPADVVLSDMAPNTIGHRQTDHLRIMAVVEAAYMFACEVLVPGGAFVAKVFQGGAQNTLISEMNQRFEKVRHIKPPASRKDSSEQYLVATGFKG
ncbi:MAG TPA: RlmE family RNA methyltransferase, partial [Alphaproteobacteria bacterium]|nr:RlmE family RNA methyltransferase [Alphaproteobacteria bacterium]